MTKLVEITNASRNKVLDVLEKYADYGINWIGNIIIKTPVPVRVGRRELFGPMLYLKCADIAIDHEHKTVLIHGFGDESERQPETACLTCLIGDEGIEPDILDYLKKQLLLYLKDNCGDIEAEDVEFTRALDISSAEFKYNGVWYKLFGKIDELDSWITRLDKSFDPAPYILTTGGKETEDPDRRRTVYLFDPVLPKRTRTITKLKTQHVPDEEA